MSNAEINPYQAPQAPLTAQIVPGDEVWQDRGLLVLRKGAVLPDRCVKCNEPAEGYRLKRNLSWHHPAIYLTILAGVLIYVIIALVIRQTARVEIGLCPRHRSRRNRSIAIAWLLFVGGIGVLVLGANDVGASRAAVLWTGLVMLLTSPFVGLIASSTVRPKKIDAYFAWLKGVCPEYLAEFPQSPIPR
ncbi:MAG TPA: hypothetical protein VGY55_04460 [Pirellulales bacterium]|jgi:hypothetical protein|nr:hypothetical protein [Pirellulales bacterium]